ncbi:MAG: hypothetical protein ACQKBY_02975, partial [Verrucomicrobiales bacterium]
TLFRSDSGCCLLGGARDQVSGVDVKKGRVTHSFTHDGTWLRQAEAGHRALLALVDRKGGGQSLVGWCLRAE